MKSLEYGGVKLESSGEIGVTLSAVDVVLDMAQVEPELAEHEDLYWKLRQALVAKLVAQETEQDIREKTPTSLAFPDQVLGEYVLVAIRVASEIHPDAEVREQAITMNTEYEMDALAREMDTPPSEQM